MMRLSQFGLRRHPFRCGLRTLLVAVFLWALALGEACRLVDGYRTEWEIERDALAAMRGAGGRPIVLTRPAGPSLLRMLVRPGRARYFDRVEWLMFFGSDSGVTEKYNGAFKQLQGIEQS